MCPRKKTPGELPWQVLGTALGLLTENGVGDRALGQVVLAIRRPVWQLQLQLGGHLLLLRPEPQAASIDAFVTAAWPYYSYAIRPPPLPGKDAGAGSHNEPDGPAVDGGTMVGHAKVYNGVQLPGSM